MLACVFTHHRKVTLNFDLYFDVPMKFLLLPSPYQPYELIISLKSFRKKSTRLPLIDFRSVSAKIMVICAQSSWNSICLSVCSMLLGSRKRSTSNILAGRLGMLARRKGRSRVLMKSLRRTDYSIIKSGSEQWNLLGHVHVLVGIQRQARDDGFEKFGAEIFVHFHHQIGVAENDASHLHALLVVQLITNESIQMIELIVGQHYILLDQKHFLQCLQQIMRPSCE